jgi:hypothetical protein
MTQFTAAAPAQLPRSVSRLLWFHERFGKPQVYALLLLAAFAAQCFWLSAHRPVMNVEMSYLSPAHIAGMEGSDQQPRSALIGALARVAVGSAAPADSDSQAFRVFLRVPFILIGALLGASVWYVSRRLYGNRGGYTALTLYAFSPAMIERWSAVRPDVVAAWGVFGCIFTGIAVAHTLYAPRAVVLWNWRRILLLGVSIGVAAAALFPTIVAVLIALGFMLYLAPHRKGAAVAILGAACAVGAAVWLAANSFSFSRLVSDLRLSQPFGFTAAPFSRGVVRALAYGFVLHNGPAFALLVAITVGIWIAWRRTRFFGTAAPLIAVVLLAGFGLVLAHQHVLAFIYMALPILFVFVGGVVADLLELKPGYLSALAKALVLAVIVVHVLFSLSSLLGATSVALH